MKKQTLLAALMAASLNITTANSQDKGTDPFVTPPKATVSGQADQPKGPAGLVNPVAGLAPQPNISTCYEVFSVPLEMAASLQRSQSDDPALYAKLVDALKKNEAKQEAFVVLRSQTNRSATSESISEMIYPTSFEGPYTSKAAGPEKKAPPAETGKANAATAPSNPADFKTRNTGTSVEVESALSEDRQSIDLRVSLQHVTIAGRTKWGKDVSEAEMPDFETQRITTSVSARVGQSHLLGTINRPPASSADPDSTNRVWFAFVTATLSK